MPIQKLEKINPGSTVCGVEDPTLIYKMIEKITVFDGFDCEGDYSYGVSKTIARCKNIANGCTYRYPLSREFILIQDSSGLTYANGLRKAGMPVGVYRF